MPSQKKYCGYRTKQVKSGRNKKSGSSRKAHTRRSCYNTADAAADDAKNCFVGRTKRCVREADASRGETRAEMETRRENSRRNSRTRAQKNAQKTGECKGRERSDCNPPNCLWANGELNQYCRKPYSGSK